MRCPYCRGDEVRVIDSRDADGGAVVRRRRQCSDCERRFTTFERYEEAPLVVVKRDGSREPFDRAKVVSGISRACKNRPVTDEDMLRLCDEVEDVLRARGARSSTGNEVATADVGLEVLEKLRDLDEVAYVRFASVYRGFTDASEFERVVQELQGGGLDKRGLEKRRPPKVRGRKGVVGGGL
jgi:transcriptional repressor NrdR